MIKKACKYWQKYASIIAWVIFISALAYISWLNIAKLGIDQDLGIYYHYAQEYFIDHGVPYGNFSPEYPPGAFLLFAFPRLYITSIEAYKIVFTILTDFVLLMGAFFIFRKGKSISLILFTIFLYNCQPLLIFQRFDAIVGIILFISLLQFSRKKYSLSIILLAISVSLKFFPIILLPFYLLWLPNNMTRLKQLVIFAFVIGLLLLPFLFLGANIQGVLHFFTYNRERGIQIESSWASLLEMLRPFQNNFEVVLRFGAVEIASSLSALFSKMAFYLSAAYLLGLFLFAWKKNERTRAADEKEEQAIFWKISFLALAGFMFLNKVFSPQYVLWLVPIVPILIIHYKSRKSIFIIVLFMLFLIATYRIWPQNYAELMEGRAYAVNNLLFRNITFLLIILYCFKNIYHKKIPINF